MDSLEMDVQIAEKVMWWERNDYVKSGDGGETYYMIDTDEDVDGGVFVCIPHKWKTEQQREIVEHFYMWKKFRPFTDITAAMQVVDKMLEDDWWWKAVYKEPLLVDITEPMQAGYQVTFRCVRGGTRGSHTESAKTLSEAICKAALAAKETNEHTG